MKHRNHKDCRVVLDNAWRGSGATHFGKNAHRTSKWRLALGALSLAPTRIHRYRNLRTAMFYDAMRKVDCKVDCKD